MAKSIEELRAIRDKMRDQIDLRQKDENNIRVVIGMATCGIAAGARSVLNAFTSGLKPLYFVNVNTSVAIIAVFRLLIIVLFLILKLYPKLMLFNLIYEPSSTKRSENSTSRFFDSTAFGNSLPVPSPRHKLL